MTTEASTGQHSYERFADRDFNVAIDQILIRKGAPIVNRAIVFASSTGQNIRNLFELGKLKLPFQVTGIDIDADAVRAARQKLQQYGDSIKLLVGNIEKASEIIKDKAELLLCLNVIHLTDAQKVISEAGKLLVSGGTLLVSSAYVKDKAYAPGTEASWGRIVALARIQAEKLGFKNIPHPIDFLKHSEEDYVVMVQDAGFTDIKTETHPAEMNQEDVKAICGYDTFAQGALPGVPTETAKKLLVEAVPPLFSRMRRLNKENTTIIPRNWMLLTAKKI